MISIRRPWAPPAKLARDGPGKRGKLIEQHRKGQEIKTDKGLYGHESVRSALNRAQHGKCAYCEVIIGDDGHVEHYRPKGAVRVSRGGVVLSHGYFWLAYEWTNLFLACGPCNSRHKLNLFPLEDESQRMLDPEGDLSRERPMFLNPADEDPELLIEWMDEEPLASRGNPRAEVTIEELRLASRNKRDGLFTKRRQTLDTMRLLLWVVEVGEATAHRAVQRLSEMARDDMEFAAMTRAYLRRHAPSILQAINPR